MTDTNGPMAAKWAVVLGLDVVERFMTLIGFGLTDHAEPVKGAT